MDALHGCTWMYRSGTCGYSALLRVAMYFTEHFRSCFLINTAEGSASPAGSGSTRFRKCPVPPFLHNAEAVKFSSSCCLSLFLQRDTRTLVFTSSSCLPLVMKIPIDLALEGLSQPLRQILVAYVVFVIQVKRHEVSDHSTTAMFNQQQCLHVVPRM